MRGNVQKSVAEADHLTPEHTLLSVNGLSDNVAATLDKKAGRARLTGTLSFCLTMTIGLGIASLFLFSHGLEPPSESKMTATANAGLPAGVLSKLAGDMKAEQIIETVVKRDIFFQIVNTAIVRVGSVIVSIFLIQILVGFSRYYYRVAEHLSACADVVRLSKGDAQIIKELAPILLPSMEFGKVPKSPVQAALDKAMDTIKEVATKSPAK